MAVDWFKLFDEMSTRLYSAALSDVLDEMGFRDQVISPLLGIKPLRSDWVTTGRAKTLYNEFNTKAEDPYELAIAGLDQVEPGQVLIAGGSVEDLGIMGELSAHRIIHRGGRGAIVHGYSRDTRQLLDLGFPVFCKGGSPIDTTGRSRVTAVDVPVRFGNREVSPGQIVFADADGIVLIPQEAEEEVITAALRRVEEETEVRNDLRKGSSFREVWERYHIL
jgi:4-hydroxy-4-methyl-2-oxoglutarate aldolase